MSTVRAYHESQGREADVTISETDRLHSQLSRLEGMFPGYKTEIVEGNIVMSPVRPFHGRTIRRLENAFEDQLPEEWTTVTDVAFAFTEGDELCPDVAVIPTTEYERNLSAYPADLIEVAVEVVSPSSVRNDYGYKDLLYARTGIPIYLIFDPSKSQCVTLWRPGPEGYLGRDTLPYGKTVTIDTPVGPLVVDTSRLPAVDQPA